MAKDRVARPTVVPNRGRAGIYVAYDRAGAEIWRHETFRLSIDAVPVGISLTMGAGMVVDSGTGEVIHTWDPWGVLATTS